jgi:hypothetical protein
LESKNWYVYVEKNSLTVCRVSPVLEKEESCHVIPIDSELGISFIESPHLSREYFIYYDGTLAHFIKKEKTNKTLVPFFYSPVIMKHDVDNPEIQISFTSKTLTIDLKKELLGYASNLYSSLERDKQFAEFYVCAKNDPNHLIKIIKIDMIKLSMEGNVVVPFEKYDPKKMSLFTRKVFNSYGINTK